MVEFPRFSLVDISASKMEWETPKSFLVDPEVVPKRKRDKNQVKKKARTIICLTFPVPVSSLPVTSLPVVQLPVMSFPVTSGDVTILLKYDLDGAYILLPIQQFFSYIMARTS